MPISYCNNPTYKNLMHTICPSTCGVCEYTGGLNFFVFNLSVFKSANNFNILSLSLWKSLKAKYIILYFNYFWFLYRVANKMEILDCFRWQQAVWGRVLKKSKFQQEYLKVSWILSLFLFTEHYIIASFYSFF